jgi:hypothetical protein
LTRRGLLLALGLLAATIVFTWPVADVRHPQLPFPHDTLFSTWRLAWIAHQLPRDPRHLFDANIFWPERNVLAFSDAMLLLGLVATPLIRGGLHPVIVHNLLLIGSFVFAGWAMARLVFVFAASWPAAIVAAAIFAFAPFRFAHIGHLELLWTGFIPLTVLALYRVLERPSVGRGVWLGTSCALQGLCSLYYLAFMLVWLVPLTVLLMLLLRQRPSVAHVWSLAAAGAVVAIVLGPYAVPYVAARESLGPRPEDEIRRYSAVLEDYVRVPWGNWMYGERWPESLEERSLFPGLTVVGLVMTSLVVVHSRVVAVFAIAAVLAIDLSLGVNGLLYDPLQRTVPLLTSMRAPARFGVLALLAFAVLSGIAVAQLTRGTRRQRVAITIALLVCLGIEYWSVPVMMRETPLVPSRAYEWLAVQPGAVTVEVPVPRANALWADEPLHTFNSIYHWRPLVNGYSGFVPQSYVDMLAGLGDFPSDAAIRYLTAHGITVVIVHERLMTPERFNAALAACGDQRWFSSVVVFDVGGGHGRIAACRVAPTGA